MREQLSSQQQTITDIFPSFQKHAGSLRSNMTISSSQHEVRLKTLKTVSLFVFCYLKKPKLIVLFLFCTHFLCQTNCLNNFDNIYWKLTAWNNASSNPRQLEIDCRMKLVKKISHSHMTVIVMPNSRKELFNNIKITFIRIVHYKGYNFSKYSRFLVDVPKLFELLSLNLFCDQNDILL